MVELAGRPPKGDGWPHHVNRRGKAPPIDAFTGDSPELRIDNWLPNLEGASLWNG